MQPRILIADDQPDILSALRLLLKREGFEVASATSPAGVLDVVAREPVDVALVDLNYARDTTSGAEGLELLARLRESNPGCLSW
jgi:CheY-like chemotaxis protein